MSEMDESVIAYKFLRNFKHCNQNWSVSFFGIKGRTRNTKIQNFKSNQKKLYCPTACIPFAFLPFTVVRHTTYALVLSADMENTGSPQLTE